MLVISIMLLLRKGWSVFFMKNLCGQFEEQFLDRKNSDPGGSGC
jgi:hypothetical protein